MPIPTLPGIIAKTLTTHRIATRVLFSGPGDGIPVLFLHGNLTSSTCWEEVMLSLPAGYRAIAPDQRGYGDADPRKKINAKRGMGDLADDAVALLDYLGLEQAHIVGHSMGGSVIWQLLIDCPERFLTATLIASPPPYGFGGIKDATGTPCHPDFAGSGAGLINSEMVRCLANGDRGLDNPFSPRTTFRTLVVKPPFIPEREEELVAATLATHLGDRDFPGDFVPSPNWPYAAPGEWGPLNALSPKRAPDIHRLYTADPKTRILWIRGDDDLIVSDHSAFEPAIAGAQGLLPDWPGPEVYPPQPMVDQTRDVLEKYAASGGTYREVALQDVGHFPYLEQPTAFNEVFHRHIEKND
uniref:Pimeloyl-ACP methyl ester carboxylesterase n=1 Tax=Candidatus Kentrum eta TaxID=2126337 RepID=A0A450U9K0_9GAMM|nr:MAG: Pimeloyl-ACP methyl ester carboxylesterase [Candidatus Kentron sp. H]VFJ90803.1 MAG: Pimeloyl-ACP methyl ester carboxylesterase [Candidatus Kentron sp. H]VFJ96929.1 MAG: Pimeloyl-ACP methyl ester carboxylesterase [Candidatus Kentron sp. H]